MEPKQQMVFKHNPSVSTYYFAVNNLFAGQIRIQTWGPATGWCNTFFFSIQIYIFWVQYKVTFFSWPKTIKLPFHKVTVFFEGESYRLSRSKITLYTESYRFSAESYRFSIKLPLLVKVTVFHKNNVFMIKIVFF